MPPPFAPDPAAFARLRLLLDEALALPPAQRAAWLAGLPAEHAALHPQLQALLAAAEADTGTGHSAPALATLRPLSPPEAPAAAPALPGDIGPWRPLRLLGEGGMGTVWLAERADGLMRQQVALKLPRGAWRQAGLAERMARERQILARLDHPHIARILDAGVTADGQPWLALAYVDGQAIDQYCAQHALGLHERLQLFVQVARAVAHAHARLVVHRDLKPGNILVTPEGEARLLDFGIGKLIDDEGAEALTQQAGRLMTPWYASPEQVLGQPIGTASDIYSLGVLLFELLTGERPYKLRRDSRGALEDAIVQAQVQRPSSVARTPWARRLRGDLDTVLLKALKAAPEQRYATVEQLADDIGHWLAQRPVTAQPDRLAYRSRKFIQRNRVGVALGMGMVVALASALGVALWQREQARLEAAKANGIKNYLVSLFEANHIEQDDALRKRQQSVQALLAQSAGSLATGLADQPEVRDELQRLVGQLLQDLELTPDALQVRQQRAQALAAQGAPAAQQVDALRALAQSHYAADDAAAARRHLAQAEQLCSGPATQPVCLGVQTDLGQLDFDARALAPALQRAEATLPLLRRHDPGGPELAAALELLGNVQLARNQSELAYALLQEAMGLRRQLLGEHSVRLAGLRYRLGRNLWVMRHLAQADQELRAAHQIMRRALGDAHPATLAVARDLGRLTAYVGLRDDGLPLLRQAVQGLLALGDRLSPSEQVDARTSLGNALLLNGQLAEARAELAAALALRERQPPAGAGVADATLDQSWARLLMDTGHYDEARRWLERLRERTVAVLGPGHPQVADRSLRLASVATAQGDLARAQQLLAEVLRSQDNREASYGSPKHRALQAQAELLLQQGRPAEAAPLLEAPFATAQRTPRADQFRDQLHLLTEQMARLRCAQGRHAEANPLFEQAEALLAAGNPQHPALVSTRAHHALCLWAQQAREPARQQLRLAQAAWAAQPSLGPHFGRALAQARERLAAPAP